MGTEPSWPLLLRLLFGVVNALPAWILRRKYPPEVIASRFGVDLDSTRASELHFGSAVPSYVLRLRYVNLNPFPVVVERLDFEIWFGQPIVEKQVWQRRLVPGHSVVPKVDHDARYASREVGPRFEFQLEANQMKYLETQMENRRLRNDVTIYIDLHGRALGQEFTKDRQRIEVPRHEIAGQGLG